MKYLVIHPKREGEKTHAYSVLTEEEFAVLPKQAVKYKKRVSKKKFTKEELEELVEKYTS